MTISLGAFLLPLAAAAAAAPDENPATDFGPLVIQSQAPLQTTGLTPMLHDPFSLQEGQTDLFASATFGSVWASTPEYTFDYYHNQFLAGFIRAHSSTQRYGVWLQYRYAANNRLDGVTKKFHNIFGIEQNGRTDVEEDRFYIDAPQLNGKPATDFVGDALLSAINLYAEQQLFQNAHHALSLGVTLFFNRVNHGVFTNTSFEQALQANYGYQRGKHRLTASVAFTHRPDKPQHFVEVEPWGISGGVSYRYRLFKHHELIGEYLLSQGKAKNPQLSDLTKPVHEFAYGYRYLFGNSALELVALENMFNHDNSTDIVFSATFRHRFL